RQRKLDVAEYRKAIDEGPLTAEEAKKAGLVDALAFDDTLEAKTKDYVGNDDLVFGTTEKAKTRRDRFGPAKRLAIIYVEGDMVDGRSQNIPFLNIRTAGSYTIAESIKRAREDRSVSAIVLRVETGGGSAMAADVIWRELELTKKKKPVVVSMGSAAASGGYYISAPGTYIYANPLTITGSIGIFYGKADVGGLLRKIGVNVETFRTSPHADAESIFRPFTNSERKTLSTKIEQFYGLFLKRVAEGRGLRVEDVDAVGRGRVWTGRQALEHRLVDDLGGLRQALAKARVLGGLRDDSPIVEWPIIKTSLLGKLLGVEGLRTLAQKDETSLPMNGEMLDGLRAAVPFALYEGDIPLARAEIITEIVP
ncbi:MAG: signal peptide peptidase SppA, partial [Polyangiaceae bacterium]|nr:signal peptide peptidase SppA [Polyangiaceae bacterium]